MPKVRPDISQSAMGSVMIYEAHTSDEDSATNARSGDIQKGEAPCRIRGPRLQICAAGRRFTVK